MLCAVEVGYTTLAHTHAHTAHTKAGVELELEARAETEVRLQPLSGAVVFSSEDVCVCDRKNVGSGGGIRDIIVLGRVAGYAARPGQIRNQDQNSGCSRSSSKPRASRPETRP